MASLLLPPRAAAREAPTIQDVQGATELLLLFAGDQGAHELYTHFGASPQAIWRRPTGVSLFGWPT